MIKLKPLYEIKIIKNITPEMVLNLWREIYDKKINIQKLTDIIKKNKKEEWWGEAGVDFVPKMNPNELNNFYHDLLNLKSLKEIKISSGATVEMIDKLGDELVNHPKMNKLCSNYFNKRVNYTIGFTSWPNWIKDLPQNEKNNMYRDLLKMKNEPLSK